MLFGGYMKEGKGVEKRDPDTPRIKLFFELLFRKFWRLSKLNILYVIACIPTFIITMLIAGLISSRIVNMSAPFIAQILSDAASGADSSQLEVFMAMFDIAIRVAVAFLFMVFCGMGPVTAGYTYILRNYAKEDHAWMFSDFFGKAKQNFWQGLLVWIIDLLVFALVIIAYEFYLSQPGAIRYIAYVLTSFVLIYLIMHFYIYPVMVTFNLSLKDVFKNSLLFALMDGPKNLLILFILLAIHLGIPYLSILFAWPSAFWIVFIILELVLLVAVSGFIVNFGVYPTIGKYVREAEKKQDDTSETL